MLLDSARLLLWLLVCTLMALVEYSTGLPLLTVTLMMLAVLSLPTIWFIVFVTLMSIVLSALFLENWFLVWLLIMGGALVFRLPSNTSRNVLVTRVSLVLLVGVLLLVAREPVITPSFVIHSFISFAISCYLLWQKSKPKSRGFNVTELRFASE